MSNLKFYKSEIAKVIQCDPEKIFLYWKGRVALYVFLKSLDLKEGDEVIVPAFTCVVVPNAIIYAGLKPVYVDISSQTYNMDISLVEKAISNRTRVILIQNTFGLSSNIEDMCLLAKKYNLYTIEDCTHGFGGFYNGKPNGSFCDAAFYSTQWNKPFSTGIGGFLVLNNKDILSSLKYFESQKIKPTIFEKYLLGLLLLSRKMLINKYTHWSFVKIYRLLSRTNLIIGSNRGEELNSTILPNEYLKDISNIQVNAGIKSLKKLNRLNRLRKQNALAYTMFLKSENKTYVDESLFANHIFLKYPLLVKNRSKFFEIAQDENISLGDWFLSPLHPIQSDLSLWHYNRDQYPIADGISDQIVNLPTENAQNSRVLKFLKENIDQIN